MTAAEPTAPVSAGTLRQRCAAEIDRLDPRGAFHERAWLRRVFLAVPREHFVPERVWWPYPRPEDGRCPALDRAKAPAVWLNAVYTAAAGLVTRVAPGTDRPGEGVREEDFDSGMSAPLTVAGMIHHLDPQVDDRVLEIGTGSGYDAALLAGRVGADRLVTMEIDAQLAVRAGGRLHELGIRPKVVTGDGAHGYAPRAPYDRILSTVAVGRVPQSWVDQLAPGGVIVAPLVTPFGRSACLRLVGDGHGHAEGGPVPGIACRPEPCGPATGFGSYRITVGDGGQHIRFTPADPD
ncbi:protein-L-isoaspartate O-methyltransferase [Streptomyces uncialis]|uniref:protein-L-isoaspartate O-methyltransferase n=1 Tax=Streptomyces uncialis TaxID=1048205 RepID=UPI003790C7E9